MDWLSRTELLLGEERLGMLKKAHVLVAGLGGSRRLCCLRTVVSCWDRGMMTIN